MKKLTVFEINDGMDGIVVAKNLKQAVKLLAMPYYGYLNKAIMKDIKKSLKDENAYLNFHITFALTGRYKVPKKGKMKRPKVLGFTE